MVDTRAASGESLAQLRSGYAIGRPGERLPELGAARFYVDDAHWREKVADVMQVAQLVALKAVSPDGK